jgi:hypothetical protein
MRQTDPAPDLGPYYECLHCQRRVTEEIDHRGCPDCGGYLRDLTVPRQE